MVLTGFKRNMNHIVLGTDNPRPLGMILGFAGIAVVIAHLGCRSLHFVEASAPVATRQKAVFQPLRLATLNRFSPSARYSKEQISPYFWPNGKRPECADWRFRVTSVNSSSRSEGSSRDRWRFSLLEIRALGKDEHITMRRCFQGWSGIARWKGMPMKTLIDLVKPKPSAKTVVFFSFQVWGRVLRHTDLEKKPECLLAYEMNGEPLPDECGAPLRLRVEIRLGYKMVKWIERIEFVESTVRAGRRR